MYKRQTQYNAIQYDTAQDRHSSILHCRQQDQTIQCNPIQHSTISTLLDTTQLCKHSSILYTLQATEAYNTMQYDMVLHYTYTFHTTSMRSTRKAANHSVGQLVSKSISTSADQSIYVGGRPVSKSVSKPVNKCQSTHQLSSQSLGRSGSSQPVS